MPLRNLPPAVLIAGGGPTGLTLAITCRRFGIPVRVIDRAPQATQVSKALAVWSGSLEAFDTLGLIDGFLRDSVRLHSLNVSDGRRRVATLRVGSGIDSPYPFPLLLPQSHTEQLLAERLAELGGTVERGTALTDLKQDGDGVTATLRHADGQNEIARAAYLVGCDGARSTVRQALQVAFDGYTEPQTYLLCDARIDGGLDPASIYLSWHAGGTVALFPVEDGIWRVFAMRDGEGGDQPATLEELQREVDQHGPGGLRLHDASWLSTFRINERLAAKYRVGRCFLAGDAAHIHSPAGGQGMNTGIQDGFNLGWKLAYALQGIGDAELLLDSYEAERRPIAADVVKGAAQKLHVAFGANGAPIRHLKSLAVSLLGRIPALQRKLQVELSETEICYRDGPLIRLGGPLGEGGTHGVGRRARDAALRVPATGQTRQLWPLLRDPCHVLLLFGGITAPAGSKQLKIITIDRSTDPTGEAARRFGIGATGWVLLRPDQVIAARGTGTDLAGFAAYAARVLQSSVSETARAA